MIHLTGIQEKDRILTPYIFQYRALLRRRGKLDPEIFMDMIDAWLITWLKVLEEYNARALKNLKLPSA